MPVLLEVGQACNAKDFLIRAVQIAEEGALQNPDTVTLTGIAMNMRGMVDRDTSTVAESIDLLRQSPRLLIRAACIEGFGMLLLESGDRDAALRHLDAAWDDYDRLGAVARRAVLLPERLRGGRAALCDG